MTIGAGTRLGPYEIVAPIGAGGMGEVYRARDTRLDRSVAIKILPSEFAHNAQLKLRFEREAKTISQLSHPNICTLYDVGDDYLVMELLEGESLADRVGRGPLPIADIFRYGAQIADALSRAHRAGVVHRDLKPGNVMITKTGAKLLDFGLAKESGVPPPSAADLTQQKPLTQEGTILGTFQYMAPEQLEGQDADARTDIFAFGALLYEMAAGKRAFEGKTKTSLIASIVGGTPRALSEIRPVTPRALEHVIAKCLEKDPDDRWQSAADVAEELRWIAAEPAAESRPRRSSLIPWLVAIAAIVIVIAAFVLVTLRKPVSHVMYSDITAPVEATFTFDEGPATIAPDGAMIVFPAVTANGVSTLWVRPLDGPVAHPLHGTEGGTFPFWSPDSKSLAFFADAKLRRIELASGTIETLADAPSGRGGSWAPDGTILFSPSPGDAIYRVAQSGGPVQPVTQLDGARGDSSHRYPAILADGRHFIAFVQGSNEGGNLLLASLDSKETKIVGTADAGVVFAPPDSVLIVRDRVLRAQRINPRTSAFEGEAFPIAEGVQASGTYNYANVSASRTGVITYVTGASATRADFVVIDQTGKKISTIGEPGDKLDPRVSPDGFTILSSVDNAGGNADIWAYDVRRNVSTQLTFAAGNEFGPVFSPDGKSMVYTSFEHRPGDLFLKRIDGSGAGEVLYGDKRRKVPSDWTRDGKYIVFNVVNPKTVWDIEAYSVLDHKTFPVVASADSDMQGHVSPDGKWIAYSTIGAGRHEVYVQRFPTSSERWQISGGGGGMPAWSRDGRQLFYVTPDGKMMAASVHPSGDQFVADAPRVLFTTGMRQLSGVTRNQYDVMPDGKFLVNVVSAEDRRIVPITIVQNWTEKLKRP